MEVHRIQPKDEAALAEFAAVWEAADRADFPDLGSFGLNDFRAFAAHEGTEKRFHLLAAGLPGGSTASAAASGREPLWWTVPRSWPAPTIGAS
jgi:hypothetical protein